MNQGPKDGFAERLQDALRSRQQRMTVQQFAHAMKQRHEQQKKQNGYEVPHSYRSISLYLTGDRVPKNQLFAQHAAVVLGVRWQWLHNAEGPMTDVIVITTTNTAVDPVAGLRLLPGGVNGPEGTRRRLASMFPRLAQSSAAFATFVNAWDRVVNSSPVLPTPEDQYAIADDLWKQIIAPLEMVGADPLTAPETYYVMAFGALMTAVPAPGQGKDLSRPPRKNAKPRSIKQEA